MSRWRRLPRRLRVGTVLLAVLLATVVGGGMVTGDPARIVDPVGADLVPPGTRLVVVTRTDGTAVAGTAFRRDGDTVIVTRHGVPVRLPDRAVSSVHSRLFVLGTDAVGRDVLARLLHGGRVSLLVGATALTLALLLGVTVGLVSGLAGGWVDAVLMRLVDAMLAVPLLFLLLLLAVIFRPSPALLVLLLGFSSWMGVARLVRGQVLSLREREFILAARGIGASPLRIAVAHLLPNTVGPLSQDAALRLGDLILVEASLSFLGLGVQPPVPSWGNMVAEGGALLGTAWWLIFPAGAMVALTVVAAALLADGLGELAR